MKMRCIVILILLIGSVSAGTVYTKEKYAYGDVPVDAKVVCERAKHYGIVHFEKELPCCVDLDGTGYCSSDEPLLGGGSRIGPNMKYLWPTWTFKPSFSHKLMYISCDGTIIITGKEYDDLLVSKNCSKVGDVAYCCPSDVFLGKPRPAVASGSSFDAPKMGGNMIMVVNKNKWAMVKKGIINDMFIKKAIRTEDERCSLGGSDIFVFDSSLGSYFSSTRNYHPGERVFMFTKPDYAITPLITWCE